MLSVGDYIRHPTRLMPLAFAAAVAIGTVLLSLPISRSEAGRADFLIALFTATAAVCVTGLIVVDTPTYWSPFGQAVILALIQVGGFGIMTGATLLGVLVNQRMGLRTRLAAGTGVALFRRTSSGLELTRDGALLAAKAEQVLAAAADIGQAARHLTSQVRGKLCIGTIIDPEFARLGSLLKALVENGPGIETELRHGMSGDVPTGLKRNELDVGSFLGDIADVPAAAEPIFHLRELVRLNYMVVAPPYLNALVRRRDWSDLAALPWVGTPPASVHHRLLARVFQPLGLRQNVVALVDQEISMLAMVRTGIALSLCRDSIALHHQQSYGLVVVDGLELASSLGFMTLAAWRDDPFIRIVCDTISRIWNGDSE